MIAIIDYGVGNLFSLKSSLGAIGEEAVVTRDESVLDRADHIILPGVGAFGDAVEKLRDTGMFQAVLNQAATGKPVLGICLGMQLLFEKSFEYGEHAGLGLIQGEVRDIRTVIPRGLAVPHMGWNGLHFPKDKARSPIFAGLEEGEHVYFVHSFAGFDCKGQCTATTEYGAELTAEGLLQIGGEGMILLPAIDLYDGKVVRLTKGDYAQMTVYRDDPAAQAADFQAAGAKWLHTVDLEGAKDGTTPNFPVIAAICKKTDLKVEIGGGIRSLDTIQKYLDAGVSRVILPLRQPGGGGGGPEGRGHRHQGLEGDRPGAGRGLFHPPVRSGGQDRHLHRHLQGRHAGGRQCGALSDPLPAVSPGLHRLGGRVKCFRLTEAEGPWLIRGDFGQGPVHRGSGFENGFEGGGVRW